MTTMTAMRTRFATEMVKMFQFRYEPGWFRSMAAGACPAAAMMVNGASGRRTAQPLRLCGGYLMDSAWPLAVGLCSEVGPRDSGPWSRPFEPIFCRTDQCASSPGTAGRSAQLAQERVLPPVRRDLNPGVYHERPVRPGDDRVEVEFGDLRQVVGQLRDPQQQVAQRTEVGGRLATVAAQQRRGADRSDEPVRVDVGQGREPGRVVGEHLRGFGVHAAEPEDHQRAEHVVVGYPDDQLGAVRDHRLDEHPALPLAEPFIQP